MLIERVQVGDDVGVFEGIDDRDRLPGAVAGRGVKAIGMANLRGAVSMDRAGGGNSDFALGVNCRRSGKELAGFQWFQTRSSAMAGVGFCALHALTPRPATPYHASDSLGRV